MWRASVRNVVRKGAVVYRACSLVLVNTIVVFALLNGFIYVAYSLKDTGGLGGQATISTEIKQLMGPAGLRKAYPGYSDAEIGRLLEETWDNRPFEYDPFTQYKEHPFAGKWVNVDQNGLRRSKIGGPWPPGRENLNVFLFGGSTTFGYGVADEETIAVHLQKFLDGRLDRPVKVYNFGAACFFSTQERHSLRQSPGRRRCSRCCRLHRRPQRFLGALRRAVLHRRAQEALETARAWPDGCDRPAVLPASRAASR